MVFRNVKKGTVMREVFQSQLHEVQTRLVEIAEDATKIIEKASKAFNTSDVALADEAIAIADQAGEKALALDELVSLRLHAT
jgi:phosphate transport system protein